MEIKIKKTQEKIIDHYSKKFGVSKKMALQIIINSFYERRNPGKWPEDLKEGDN
nr:hypothetical protein YKEOBPQY_YKEOBPQY_CDS_0005 [Microvirus sp.]